MSPEKIAIIGAIATVIAGFGGAVFGAWITRISSNNLMRRQDFNKAATTFRNAFLPETTFLKYNANIGGLCPSNSIHEMLRGKYLPHLKALEIFKDCLTDAERTAIDRAWDEYCHPNGVPQDPKEKRDFRFNDYFAIEDNQGIEEAKKIALQRIERILEFAKQR